MAQSTSNSRNAFTENLVYTHEFIEENLPIKKSRKHISRVHGARLIITFLVAIAINNYDSLAAFLALILLAPTTILMVFQYRNLSNEFLKIAKQIDEPLFKDLTLATDPRRIPYLIVEIESRLIKHFETKAQCVRPFATSLTAFEVAFLVSIVVWFINAPIGFAASLIATFAHLSHGENTTWRIARMLQLLKWQKESVSNYPRFGINVSEDFAKPPEIYSVIDSIERR